MNNKERIPLSTNYDKSLGLSYYDYLTLKHTSYDSFDKLMITDPILNPFIYKDEILQNEMWDLRMAYFKTTGKRPSRGEGEDKDDNNKIHKDN